MSKRTDPKKHGPNQSFDILKDILVKPEKDKIRLLEDRLDDPMVRAREMSQSLPQAISLSVMEDDKISRVIEPVIDASLKASVKNNPKAIADAIFPALGPGIRKAITSTLMGMIQSLNQVLNHSFSIQGLKWRFEAFKTKRPFAEVVLLNTLVFQVEQVFLIHKQSGLVLEHVVAKDAIIQDPDLVSAMLTAIQDFVKDSFSGDSQGDLETLRTGSDRSIWIEQGEHAILAAVIRGTPPMDLRISYRELLEEIHIKAGKALVEFNGDPVPFAVFREQLKDGLQYQEKKGQKKLSPWMWVIFAAVLIPIGFWGWHAYLSIQAWQHFSDRLSSQKGIIILSTHKQDGTYMIKGLKDPLVPDPAMLLTKNEKKRIQVKGSWKPYYSLDSEFILQRANDILRPPSTITLALDQTTLMARGSAGNKWIKKFNTQAPALPGITTANDNQIKNLDKNKLHWTVKRLTSARVYFKNNSSRLADGQEEKLKTLIHTIHEIETIQTGLNTLFRITVLGHTDSSGGEKHNLKLSRNRAEKIFNHLIVNGINPAFLNMSGVGTKIPLITEDETDDRQYNRAVSFKIFYIDSTKGNE